MKSVPILKVIYLISYRLPLFVYTLYYMRFSYRSFLLLALPSAPCPSFLQVLLLCCRLSFCSQSFFRAAALPSAPCPSFLQVLLLCSRLSFCSQSFFRAATLPSAPCPSFGPALLPCCNPPFCSLFFFCAAGSVLGGVVSYIYELHGVLFQ